MKTGTKSLFFGVHQFLWHPILVFIAWTKLYGLPSFREAVCIFIHDWGYFGCESMEGVDGSDHSRVGAEIAEGLFGIDYYRLVLFHSRHFARKWNRHPSKLCWADKLSFAYEWRWFYLLRARASGELAEYRALAAYSGVCPREASDDAWFTIIRGFMIKLVITRDPSIVCYIKGENE